jgi:hypothetical protein
MTVRWKEHGCSPGCDCRVATNPLEKYMVTDALWAAAGFQNEYCCIECLEWRIGRTLEPADPPPIPINDDDDDSVRLRTRKGSGRRTADLYEFAERAIGELGADVSTVAARLGLLEEMLKYYAPPPHGPARVAT